MNLEATEDSQALGTLSLEQEIDNTDTFLGLFLEFQ